MTIDIAFKPLQLGKFISLTGAIFFANWGKSLWVLKEKRTLATKKLIALKTRNEYMNIIRSHATDLYKRFGITSMRLFGSVARGEHKDGSDIDLFVTMPSKFYNYVAASEYLEGLLGCSVDLISDHENIRPFFRKQIERDGINIFTTVGDCQGSI